MPVGVGGRYRLDGRWYRVIKVGATVDGVPDLVLLTEERTGALLAVTEAELDATLWPETKGQSRREGVAKPQSPGKGLDSPQTGQRPALGGLWPHEAGMGRPQALEASSRGSEEAGNPVLAVADLAARLILWGLLAGVVVVLVVTSCWLAPLMVSP